MDKKNVAPKMMAIAVILLTLIMVGCQLSLRGDDPVEPYLGEPAPDFTVTLLDEAKLDLADWHGRPVILNFWATWCAPCRQEMPLIDKLYKEQAEDGLAVLAVNYGESLATITDFMSEVDYTFPIALDPDLTVAQSYLVKGMPTTYFIDRDGIISQVYIGEMTSDILQNYTTAIIEGS